MGKNFGQMSNAGQAAVKNRPADRMLHYPADFTSCGCAFYNHGGVACGLVKRDGSLGAKRICEVCGCTWEGDFKRHKNLPLVDWRRPKSV